MHNGLNIRSQDTAIKYIKSPLSDMLGMSSPENGFMAVDIIRKLFLCNVSGPYLGQCTRRLFLSHRRAAKSHDSLRI